MALDILKPPVRYAGKRIFVIRREDYVYLVLTRPRLRPSSMLREPATEVRSEAGPR